MANKIIDRRKGKSRTKKVAARQANRATTRSTAGPGYQFEDLVAAHLLVRMLLGRPLPGTGPGGTKLQFQTNPLGWHIDDLLATAVYQTSPRQLALSCKSNHQVTGKGLPAEFVNAAWAQWRGADPNPMNRRTDTVALVTRGQPNAFPSLWADIVQWCSAGDDALAVARIRKSAKHASVFDSIRKPVGGPEATDLETVELIKHLAIVPLDFQLEPSRDLEDAIEWCRGLVASGSRTDAEALWKEIVRLASEARVVGGTILLDGLWRQLRSHFGLNARPDFSVSWQSLASITNEHKAGISTALLSGYVVPREAEQTAFKEHLERQPFTLVFGESGSGKSALVKQTLDSLAVRQVWLGPDQAAAATSELERSKLQLAYPLDEVLAASPAASNVLVIDAAEKLSLDALGRLRALLEKLIPLAADAADTGWKAVVVTQADGWIERAVALLGQRTVTPLAIGLLEEEEVRNALLSTTSLRWLASDAPSVSALRNLKMLSWVIEAEAALTFTQADVTSPPALADRIWGYWTGGRADAQRLLMTLSEREANFERSFPLTDLTPGDTAAFDQAPPQLPLHLNTRNSLVFDHDLAADWSRFQWLKQVPDDSDQWAPLAQNPLWSSALRLLGQFLLREPAGGTTAWDAALAAARARDDKPTMDILLEALCLDPQASSFLEERAALLLEHEGALLERLLRRFLHTATVPRFPPGAFKVDASLGLYLEASLRNPIIGRWPAMARFLHRHLADVAKLASPTVSKACETWLMTTPPDLGEGRPMPLRRELAEVALANAHTVQVQKATGIRYLGDGWEPLYSAALSGAGDLPEVGVWILEEAHRRPISQEIADRIADIQRREAEARAERLRSYPEFAAKDREQRRQRRSIPRVLGGYRELPPWPIGPQGRIDHEFRKVAAGATALAPFMRANPQLAAEALLAILIEGNPEERFSESSLHDDLGLEYDHTAYPTAFWKSPFFQFLQIAPDVALTTIIQLVEFCTERWASPRRQRWGEEGVPAVHLQLSDGQKRFVGDGRVFDWTQDDDNGQGQLHCALNALERWLTQELEAGRDVEPHITRLMRESASVAVLGLLTNIAKFRPALLEGILQPLLSSEELYWFDAARLRHQHFTAWAWVREGEAVYELAREWAFAPYRQQPLPELAIALVKKSPAASGFVQSAITTWPEREHPKDAVECAILRAALNPANYRARVDASTGEGSDEFVYPAELLRKIEAFEEENAPRRQRVMLPYQLEEFLRRGESLTPESAEQLASVLAETTTNDAEANVLPVAIAATLVARAAGWLASHADVAQQVRTILRETALSAANTHEDIRGERVGLDRDDLKFAAFGVMHLWTMEGHASEWDEPLLRILTSGNRAAARTLGLLGYQHRAALGGRWWRLLQVGLFWSALSMFTPEYGDDDQVAARWSRWLGWLRSRSLEAGTADASAIDPIRIWNLLQKVERIRWEKQVAKDRHRRPVHERHSHGLQTDFLDGLFSWLVGDASEGVTAFDAELRELLLRFWAYEQQWCAQARNDREEYHLPYQLGYHVLEKLAWVAATDPADNASAAWRQVLQLDSGAHVLIAHFLRAFFLHAGQKPDLFVSRWKEMLKFALSAPWTAGQQWFYGHRLLRTLLGFGLEASLGSLPNMPAAVEGMKPLYEQWTVAHVGADEENIAAFAYFLTKDLGAPLRMDGLKWLAAALEAKARTFRWDQDGSGEAMIGLLDTTLTKNATDLSRDAEARTALVRLAAELASKHVPAALALQERIKGLR